MSSALVVLGVERLSSGKGWNIHMDTSLALFPLRFACGVEGREGKRREEIKDAALLTKGKVTDTGEARGKRKEHDVKQKYREQI